jgi:hypothetical protein
VHPEAEEVLVAGHESGRLSATKPSVEDRWYLIDGRDLDTDATAGVGHCPNVGRRKERLSAEQALRLCPPKFRARSSDVQRYKAPDDVFTGRRVMETDAPGDLAPDPHVAAEGRPFGADDDRSDDIAITWHRRQGVSRGGVVRSGLSRRS